MTEDHTHPILKPSTVSLAPPSSHREHLNHHMATHITKHQHHPHHQDHLTLLHIREGVSPKMEHNVSMAGLPTNLVCHLVSNQHKAPQAGHHHTVHMTPNILLVHQRVQDSHLHALRTNQLHNIELDIKWS